MSNKRSLRRQALRRRTCLFCASSAPLNGEHIFGDWLQNLGYTGEGVREIARGDGSEPIIQRGGPFSKKLKVVCYLCNNEWMSGMETAAQPVLTAMRLCSTHAARQSCWTRPPSSHLPGGHSRPP